VLHLAAKNLDQVSGAAGSKTNHINDYIGSQFLDLMCKGATLLSLGSIYFDLPHRLPCGMGLVRGMLLPANRDHLMPGIY
jgi:hypothetical protein